MTDPKELLSAYLDGELTQAEQQRVRIFLEDSAEGREHLEELRKIKEATQSLAFEPPPDDRIDELERRLSVQSPRRFGWLFFVVGAVVLAAFSAYLFIQDPDVPAIVKFGGGALGLGVAFLFGSVARQRWLEYPHDRYRGVIR